MRCDDFAVKMAMVRDILKGSFIFLSEPFLSSFFVVCSGRRVTPAPDSAISDRKFGFVDSTKIFGV